MFSIVFYQMASLAGIKNCRTAMQALGFAFRHKLSASGARGLEGSSWGTHFYSWFSMMFYMKIRVEQLETKIHQS
jgi:hypothetical protein